MRSSVLFLLVVYCIFLSSAVRFPTIFKSRSPSGPTDFNSKPFYTKGRVVGNGHSGTVSTVKSYDHNHPAFNEMNRRKRYVMKETGNNKYFPDEVKNHRRAANLGVAPPVGAAFTSGNGAYMAVQELPYGDLSNIGSLPKNSQRKAAQAMVGRMETLLENGIYHRDMKPANAGLSKSGRVKFIDFGNSQNIDPTNRDQFLRRDVLSMKNSMQLAGADPHALAYFDDVLATNYQFGKSKRYQNQRVTGN